MALVPGTRVAWYQVLSPLGVGGMGEVYRARDTKLNRDVALKILPAAVADHPLRRVRIQREAQVLAALNHPNIAQIHGVEDSQSPVLVMELVEGPTLAEMIGGAAGRGIPLEDTLAIARQIADALAFAHDRGIVHRDLKPANIKVRDDGIVKVLDFGLAKVFDSSPAGEYAAAAGTFSPDSPGWDATDSPTVTTPDTRAGGILGTAAYMAPEQASGRIVDRRADIWAFGIVLYEMLTGRRLFQGDTPSATMALIIERDVDLSALTASTPQSIVTLLARCLTKDPRSRLQAMGEARLVIEEAIAARRSAIRDVAAAAPRGGRAARTWWSLVAATALVAAVALWRSWQARTDAPLIRVSTELSPGVNAVIGLGASAVLSPDGTVVAFVGATSRADGTDGIQVFVRRTDQLEASALPGTQRGRVPFFSPDGQWIAFFADGKLKKTPTAGGAVVTVADIAQLPRGGAWGENGTMVLAGGRQPGLLRVSSAGGVPEAITTLDAEEAGQAWPQMLPGDRAILYTSYGRSRGEASAALVVQPLPSGPRKVVQRGGYFGRYASSGHLLYIRDGTLFAVPFDIKRFETRGPPVPAVDPVQGILPGGAEYSVSNNGTLVYFPGAIDLRTIPMSWMDRSGKVTSLRETGGSWRNPAFAPDGERLAFDTFTDGQNDVWVYAWQRDALSRVTADSGGSSRAVWTPDGHGIAFASKRDGNAFNLFWQAADSPNNATRLTESKNNQYPTSWHPSGRFLAFDEDDPSQPPVRSDSFSGQTRAGSNVMILPMSGSDAAGWKAGTPIAFANARFDESGAAFSRDGRWISYTSNETGRSEVYVRSFPGPGGKWQISSNGGSWPTWSLSKDELFYLNDQNRLMVASYATAGDTFRFEPPHSLSDARVAPGGKVRWFALHPDGGRFVVPVAPPGQSQPSRPGAGAAGKNYVFLFNFFDELRRIAPSK